MPVLAAGAALVGTYMTNQQSADNAQNQMNFQAQQSSTQYQRAVKDMTAAGINPMLASQVGGNSAASGAMAPVQNYAGAMSSAATAAQIDLLKSQTDAADSQSVLNRAAAAKTVQDTLTSSANQANVEQDTAVKRQQIVNLQAQADRLSWENNLTDNQINLVRAQVRNAALTGTYIQANTGNVQADTVLKQLAKSQATAESNMYSGTLGGLMPYLKPTGTFLNAASTLKNLGD